MPIVVSPIVKKLYDTIEQAPTDKIVIIDSNWGVDIRAEAEGQMRAVVEHLMRRKIKFAMFSWVGNPLGQKNGFDVCVDIERKLNRENESKGDSYRYEHGKDWIAWAAVVGVGGAELQAMSKDIHGMVKNDIYGKPLSEAPMMKNIKDIYDVYLIVSIVYDWTWSPWLGFVQGIYGTNYAIGVSAITSSTAYSYIASGQMCGMLSSAGGAAEYEQLLNVPDEERFAKKKVAILSMAVAYIIIMIALGNMSYYSSRRREQKQRA
jgi:hypothetical protein